MRAKWKTYLGEMETLILLSILQIIHKKQPSSKSAHVTIHNTEDIGITLLSVDPCIFLHETGKLWIPCAGCHIVFCLFIAINIFISVFGVFLFFLFFHYNFSFQLSSPLQSFFAEILIFSFFIILFQV